MDGIYGNQQSMMTMNRVAYGDTAAAMMAGVGTVYGGASMGMSNMLGDIGQHVMPATYMPPARVHAGYFGMYQQHTGLMRGLAGMVGLESVPRGTTALEYGIATAGATGERFGAGMTGAATAGAGILGGMALSAPMGALGRLAAGAIGGFAGGAILPFLATSAAASAVQDAVGQRRDIQNFLETSSFRFVGPGSGSADPRLGGGFSRAGRQQVSEFIRQQDIGDPFMNTGELTEVLRQGTQLGLFNGTQDMDDFKKKFKDITESVKNVTRTLHQTLEEGMKTIRDLKSIGVDPSQVKGFVGQADMLGRIAGRTGAEMLSLGLQGAEIFRGTGVQMSVGAQATMMNTASIRASRDAGMLSQEAIVQAGGEEALAMRMTASGLAFGQSTMGRGFGAAFFNPMGGGAGFNPQGFMGAMMGGGGSFTGMAAQAAANLSTPGGLIAYQANQEKFMTEMGKTFGGRGLQMAQTATAMAYAQYMANSTGAKVDDTFRLALKEQGMSVAEIDARLAEIKGSDKNFQTGQASVAATRDKMIIDEAQNNFVFNRLGAQVGDKLKGVVDIAARPLNNFIDATAESFIRFKEEQVYGVQRASSGGVDLSIQFATAGAKAGAIDLDRGGSFSTTVGENILDRAGGKLAGTFGLNVKRMRRSAVGSDTIILNDGIGGMVDVVSKADFEAAAKKARVLGMTEGEAKQMQEAGALRGVKGSLVDMIAAGKAGTVNDFNTLAKAMFGTTDLTPEQQAKLIMETKGTNLEKIVAETRSAAGSILSGDDATKLEQLGQMRREFDSAKKALSKEAGFDLSMGVAERIAKAQELERTGKSKEAQKMRAEAVAMQARSGTDLRAAEEGLSRIKDADQLSRVAGTARGIAEIQSARGSSMLSQAVESELYGERGAKLSQDQRTKIGDVAAVLGRATNVDQFVNVVKSKEAVDLQRIDVGAAIVKQADLFQQIEKFSGNDVEKFQSLLKKQGISDPQKLANLSRTFAEKGSKAAAQSAFESFQQEVAGAGGAYGASGTAAERGGTAATAQQSAATQTNINLQVLSAMQGLAAKLGVR